MDRPDKWKTESNMKIAECRVFDVLERISVNQSTRQSAAFFVIKCPDWVNVIPVDDNGGVILIEQYRHGTEEVTLEIPGGMVDEGETPLECARRELREETGYRERQLVYLGRSRPNPAIQDNWIHHFAADGCVRDGLTKFDEHESIVTRTIPVERLTELVTAEEITHSLVITAIAMFENFRKRRSDLIYES